MDKLKNQEKEQKNLIKGYRHLLKQEFLRGKEEAKKEILEKIKNGISVLEAETIEKVIKKIKSN